MLYIRTSRSGSENGSGFRMIALTTVKIAVLAPMHSASVSSAVAVKARSLTKSFSPNRKSCNMMTTNTDETHGGFAKPCDCVRYTGTDMRKLLLAGTVMAASLFGASSVLDHTLKSIDGKAAPLTAYKGKVILMVNVASKCGYTPQYEGLEATYRKYKEQGLVILGFPANNFGGQEPGTDEEIKTFCSSKYNVTFPMFSKISVKGEDKAPLYQFLTDSKTNPTAAGEIKWK